MLNINLPSHKSLFLISSVAFSSILLTGCDEATASAETKPEKEEISIPIEVSTIDSGDISSTYQTTAILEAKEETEVTSKVSGIVEKIFVEEADYVEKGQIIAQLDSNRFELQLQKAKAEYNRVKSELNRIEKVHGKKYVSADQYTQLKWQLEAAKVQLNIAKLDVEETSIKAPISGFIAKRHAKVGNLINQYQENSLFHIVNLDELQGIIHLPEQQLQFVKPKLNATLKLSAISQPQKAYIERISPVIDAQTGTFKVTLKVPNPQHTLKAGMFAKVDINYDTHTNVVRIPRTAVIEMDNQHTVYIVEENKVSKKILEIGYQEGGYYEVINGVATGQQVVTAGHNNLKDQAKVQIVSTL
ncbi:efflux RND transporter periplasmic adaptor subunit [Flocculibacter collagenilyticus]|uniref:efflux RND transporter periplasmic adaptor subunit n=1 Tax=Flocculibacter collagenilyticus TaxID=2744479 RepID=UPI0018F501C3|nr:efflux RND transporter periplasmic adaptor subunit [Flocculibacter collagenilyticus]